MKRTMLYSLLSLLLALLAARAALAANEVEYVVQEQMTSATPIFMTGSEGDLTRIKGFSFTGNLLLRGVPRGTFSGELIALNPPISFTAVYQQGVLTSNYVLPGIGAFDNTMQAVWLNSSTTESAGDLVVSWSGSISNGTGAFVNAYGLSAGVGIVNQFTGQGEMTEVLRIRFSGF